MIFVSTMTYALGKELGFEAGSAEFARQLADPSSDSLPCVRTIARLRRYDEIAIHHDIAATCVGKARSRAFHEALKLEPDVYLCVDDDVEADSVTLGNLIDAVRNQSVVCLAPCVTRGSNVVNVALPPDPEWRELPGGGRTVRALNGGFGLVAMSGLAMGAIARHWRNKVFRDDDGQRKLALFFDTLDADEIWSGEDVSFCRRALEAGVRLEALTVGVTSHAGQILKLDQVVQLPELQAVPQPVA